MQVHLRGFDLFVPEPQRDRVEVDLLGSEQHRVGVPQGMWGDALGLQRRACLRGGRGVLVEQHREYSRSKWFAPLFAVALGIVIIVAQWIGGDRGSGLASLAIMTAFGALLLFGGRSETIRGLRGDGRDERFRQIDIHATAIAGLAVIIAIIIASRLSLCVARRDRRSHLPDRDRHLQNPRLTERAERVQPPLWHAH
jgi:hypothetical protein